MQLIILLGMCGKIIGLIPSGPGDFFALKPSSAFIILSLLIQSSYLSLSSAVMILFVLQYFTFFPLYGWGNVLS